MTIGRRVSMLGNEDGRGISWSSWRVARRFANIVAVVFVVLFALGWAVVALSDYAMLSSDTELPIGGPSHIAVDNRGRIYVVSDVYYRVQIYSSSGKFIRAVHVPYLRSSEVAVTSSGCIYTRGPRGDIAIYNCRIPTGVATGSARGQIGPMTHDQFVRQIESRSLAHGLEHASLSWFWPRIVDRRNSRQPAVVYRMPWYLWIINVPFPVMLWGAPTSTASPTSPPPTPKTTTACASARSPAPAHGGRTLAGEAERLCGRFAGLEYQRRRGRQGGAIPVFQPSVPN